LRGYVNSTQDLIKNDTSNVNNIEKDEIPFTKQIELDVSWPGIGRIDEHFSQNIKNNCDNKNVHTNAARTGSPLFHGDVTV